MKILVTGAAGFIGFHLVQKLIKNTNYSIIGLDSINEYYDPSLKLARLKEGGITLQYSHKGRLTQSNFENYKFIKLDLNDSEGIDELFKNEQFDIVINLAAQAGVRYSLENPRAYLNSNLDGFFNILEASKENQIKHLIYASSSSVYGLADEMPFKETYNTDKPISLYAATKKSNEILAYSYSHMYKLPTTGLRFFTVYGPWGRPDMALFKFTKNILEDKKIEIYGNGEMERDFTYVDDIVESVSKLVELPPSSEDGYFYRILNIGRGQPVKLMDFIKILETKLNKKAKYKFLDMQPGDVKTTFADTTALEQLISYKPKINLDQGISDFIDWYISYYK